MRLNKEQQKLVEDNCALVKKVISDKVKGANSIGIFSYEDLYQIGCIGLCKAAYTDKYQYEYKIDQAKSEETQFSTYAYRLIWNEICTKLGYATKMRAESPSGSSEELSILHTDITAKPNEDIALAELRSALDTAITTAAKNTTGVTAKGIQALRYMALGFTSTEIGEMMGDASCHNVTAWISKARKYLKSCPELIRLLESA